MFLGDPSFIHQLMNRLWIMLIDRFLCSILLGPLKLWYDPLPNIHPHKLHAHISYQKLLLLNSNQQINKHAVGTINGCLSPLKGWSTVSKSHPPCKHEMTSACYLQSNNYCIMFAIKSRCGVCLFALYSHSRRSLLAFR